MRKKIRISSLTISIFCSFLCLANTPEKYGLSVISDSFSVNPTSLLTPSRFDITAKTIYARHKEKNVHCNWANKLYEKHLIAINNLCERYSNDFPALKKGITNFTDSFSETLQSIKTSGFKKTTSIIPVDKNGNPRDGSHRVAACILYAIEPICKMYNYNPPVSYLFADYLAKRGLEQKYLGAMALEYCTLKKNAYVVTVMPAAVGHDQEIRNILNDHGTIVYCKKVLLSWNGAINFTKLIYKNESWLGNWKNNFSGAQHKARYCFPQDHRKKNPMRVFLFECENVEDARKCKQKIRDLFEIENHSVHINDTHNQSIETAQALFVENSIHFLNNAQQKNFPNFFSFLKQYKQWIKNNNIDPEDLCIENGAVLSAYGARDCGDIDFLHKGYGRVLPKNKNLESHNKHHPHDKDGIIYNPENYFWYDGIKFSALHVVKNMKKNAGGIQNKNDLQKINNLLAA